MKNKFTEMFIELSTTFHMTFVQSFNSIGPQVDVKGIFLKKYLNDLLLRNHKGDEDETWHTCLYINCVLFRSDKNSGCYGNLYLP